MKIFYENGKDMSSGNFVSFFFIFYLNLTQIDLPRGLLWDLWVWLPILIIG
jgi:hypothetical protein